MRRILIILASVAAACGVAHPAPGNSVPHVGFPGHEWVDQTHSNIGERIQQTAVWLDTRFGDSSVTTAGTAACTAMVGVEALLEDGGDLTLRARGRADYDLPRMEHRFRLFVDNFRHDMLPGLDPVEAGEQFKIGTALEFYRDMRSLFDLDAGIRPRLPPEPFATLRYAYDRSIGDWLFMFVQKGFWTVDDHLGLLTAATFSRRFDDCCLFRSVTAAKLSEESEGIESEQTLGVAIQFAGGSRQLDLSGSIFLERNDAVNYRLRVGWRARLLREWNTVYVIPELQFPDDHDFRCRPGIRIGMETAYW